MSKKANKSHKASQDKAAAPEGTAANTDMSAAADASGQAGRSEEGQTAAEAVPVERELAGLEDRYQRLGADYANYQKRALRQIEQARELAQEDMVRRLLPVLDNFEHALDKGAEHDDVSSVLQGMRIVYDHLRDVLGGCGLEPIAVAQGEPFDPARHEAMLHEPTERGPANSVLRELARGYVMNGRTLRPAKVSIAKAAGPQAVERETPERPAKDEAEEQAEDGQ